VIYMAETGHSHGMAHDPDPSDFKDMYGNPIQGGDYALVSSPKKFGLEELDYSNLFTLNPGPSRMTGNWGAQAYGAEAGKDRARWFSAEETGKLVPAVVNSTQSSYLKGPKGENLKSSAQIRRVRRLLSL
jgi:hypothetical protein